MTVAAPRPRQHPAAPGRARRDWPWGPHWAVGLFALYAAFSISRHRHFGTTGYDLGIFEQAVRGYAEGRGPVSDLRGRHFNLFGDHFHPVIATLAPLYRLLPHTETLLVAQAALLALPAVPLGRFAARRLGDGAGHAVAFGYGVSFGVQGAVSFDFHEVAFAAPLLACALVAVAEDRRRAAVAWALPLIAVKEELSLTVAAIGVVLWLRGGRRPGAALVLTGLAAFTVIVTVVVPAFNPAGVYPYFHTGSAGGTLSGGEGLLGRLLEAPTRMLWPWPKPATLVLLGMLTGFLWLRSPIALVALPNLAVRFLSDSPAYWGDDLQYSLTLMPVVFAAYADAAPALLRSGSAGVRALARRSPAVVAVVALCVAQHYPLQDFVLHPAAATAYDAHQRSARRLLRLVPDGALVEATNHLSPHLTSRTTVVTWPLVDVRPDWAVIDLTEGWPVGADRYRARIDALTADGYREVAAQDGIVVLRAPDRTP